MPAVYCYDWAMCIVHWLVIRADLAENDNRLKHNDRPCESKRGEEAETEMRERKIETRRAEREMCETHAHTHTAVQSDSMV